MSQVGVITIGQAPRDDMTRAFAPHFDGTGVAVVQRGALDGFTAAEITTRFAPREGSATYVSKLLTGESVEIAKTAILGRMQAHVDELAATCDAIVIVCTGDFPMLASDTPLYFPDRLLVDAVRERNRSAATTAAAAAADADAGGAPATLGLIVPLPGQEAVMAEKWQSLGVPLAFASASPYLDSDIEGAALKLAAEGARTIVLDCIGYTRAHAARALRALVAGPDPQATIEVLVPQDLVPETVAASLGLTPRDSTGLGARQAGSAALSDTERTDARLTDKE
ncbi:AroM family protein [Leucobacter sp. UCMA 4100]|uniref:AroM family protein n=1 Tax=Leucobacter sp. UCMA 4100 TaxID=2810534 RepID=UPI0022EA194E|nr:AroM family protein [Leucobacter sp. UCMA 4100]MDA3146938.1 AroM family protein [Leucobacter sp. UCMA 4100]